MPGYTPEFDGPARSNAMSDPNQHETARRLTNLPVQRNRLIGRSRDANAVCQILLGEDGCLVTLVGPAHARMIMYTARRIDATEAHRIGLVNQVVPVDQLRASVFGSPSYFAPKALTKLVSARIVRGSS